MRIFAAVLLLSSLVYAQQPPSTAPAQIESMKQCSFLAGEWKGDGWMMFGPKDRRTFTETESVQPKLAGLVLLIEGHGTGPDGKTVHLALATVSYDPQSKSYPFRSYDAQGHYLETSATCGNNTFVWTMNMSPRKMRYTITLNDKQQWFEIGETSADGTTWTKFFEMTLDRVK